MVMAPPSSMTATATANGMAIRTLRAREMTGWFSSMASSGPFSCVDPMVLGESPRMGRVGAVVWFQPAEEME